MTCPQVWRSWLVSLEEDGGYLTTINVESVPIKEHASSYEQLYQFITPS